MSTAAKLAAAKQKIASKPALVALAKKGKKVKEVKEAPVPAPAPVSVHKKGKKEKKVAEPVPVIEAPVPVPAPAKARKGKAKAPAPLAPAAEPVGVADAKVGKEKRRFSKKTLGRREIARLRFGKGAHKTFLCFSVAKNLVRATVAQVRGLENITFEDGDVIGLGNAAGKPGKGRKTRFAEEALEDMRDATEAWMLRYLRRVACLVAHDNAVTALGSHMETVSRMDEIEY